MGVLRTAPSRLALGFALAGVLGGCSLTLDPDDLVAERQDAVFADVDTVATEDAADTRDAADTLLPDTQVVDTELPADTADTTVPEDTADTAPDEVDAVDAKALVLHVSGESGCTLDYYAQAITSCPKACPASAGGWPIVVDATGSTGYTSFRWKFSATENFSIDSQATGARVGVTLSPPDCALFDGSIGPARVLIDLSVDNGPYETVKTLDFSVRLSSTCTNGAGDCPAP